MQTGKPLSLILCIILLAACKKSQNQYPATLSCAWFPIYGNEKIEYYIGNGKSVSTARVGAVCTDSSIVVGSYTFMQKGCSKIFVSNAFLQNVLLYDRDVMLDTTWVDSTVNGTHYKTWQIQKNYSWLNNGINHIKHYSYLGIYPGNKKGTFMQFGYCDSIGIVEIVLSNLDSGQDTIYQIKM